MGDVDKKLWASIVSANKVIETAREYWFHVRVGLLAMMALYAVEQVVTGGGWSKAVDFLLWIYGTVAASLVVKLIFARYELLITKSESELAHRLDQAAASSKLEFVNEV